MCKGYSKRLWLALGASVCFVVVILKFHTVLAASTAQDVVFDIIAAVLKYVAAISILIGLFSAGLGFLLGKSASEERARASQKLLGVALGAVVLGAITFLAQTFVGVRNEIYKVSEEATTGTLPEIQSDEKIETSFVARLISNLLDLVVFIIQNIARLIGCRPLDFWFFHQVNLFTPEDYVKLNAFYKIIMSIALVPVIMMLARTGLKLIFESGKNVHSQVLLREELSRWLVVAIGIGAAPILLQTVFAIAGSMSKWLFDMFAVKFATDDKFTLLIGKVDKATKDFLVYDDLMKFFKVSDPIITSLIKLLYISLFFKINLTFLVRQIILATMYFFTPIAITTWGINKNSFTVKVWLGELFTNAFMGFFYGFSMLSVITLLNTVNIVEGPILAIVGMAAIPTIASALRNSFQGLFATLGGINEEALGRSALGSFKNILKVGTSFAGAASGVFMGARATGTSTAGSNVGAGTAPSGTPSGTAGGTETTGGGTAGGGAGLPGDIPIAAAGNIFGNAMNYSTASASGSTGGIGGSGSGGGTPVPGGAAGIADNGSIIRSAFAQTMANNLFTSKGVNAGERIKGLFSVEGDYNPLMSLFGSVVGGAISTVGASSALKRSVRDTTFKYMAATDYKNEFGKLSNVFTRLDNAGVLDKAYGLLASGNKDAALKFITKHAGVLSPDEERAVESIVSGYGNARKEVMKQVGLRASRADSGITSAIQNGLYFARVATNIGLGNIGTAERLLYRKQPQLARPELNVFKM